MLILYTLVNKMVSDVTKQGTGIWISFVGMRSYPTAFLVFKLFKFFMTSLLNTDRKLIETLNFSIYQEYAENIYHNISYLL